VGTSETGGFLWVLLRLGVQCGSSALSVPVLGGRAFAEKQKKNYFFVPLSLNSYPFLCVD